MNAPAENIVLAWPLVVNPKYGEDAGLWLPKRWPGEDDEYMYPSAETMAETADHLRRALGEAPPGSLRVDSRAVTVADVDAPDAIALLEPTLDERWLESVEKGEPGELVALVTHEVLDSDAVFHCITGVYDAAGLTPGAAGSPPICHLFTHHLHIDGEQWEGTRDWAVRVEAEAGEA